MRVLWLFFRPVRRGFPCPVRKCPLKNRFVDVPSGVALYFVCQLVLAFGQARPGRAGRSCGAGGSAKHWRPLHRVGPAYRYCVKRCGLPQHECPRRSETLQLSYPHDRINALEVRLNSSATPKVNRGWHSHSYRFSLWLHGFSRPMAELRETWRAIQCVTDGEL